MYPLLITYDLIKPGQDYKALFAAIKAVGTWARPLESVWIVVTRSSAKKVRDELEEHIDENDKLLVIPVGEGWASWNLTEKVAAWMDKNI